MDALAPLDLFVQVDRRVLGWSTHPFSQIRPFASCWVVPTVSDEMMSCRGDPQMNDPYCTVAAAAGPAVAPTTASAAAAAAIFRVILMRPSLPSVLQAPVPAAWAFTL